MEDGRANGWECGRVEGVRDQWLVTSGERLEEKRRQGGWDWRRRVSEPMDVSIPAAQLGQLAWCGDNDNQGEIREDRYTSGHHLPRLFVIESSIEQSGQAGADENEVRHPTE